MRNIILFGAPGAGKGTQSTLLLQKYNFAYISTGELLRNEIKKGTELGVLAEKTINEGKLLSDDIIINIISSFMQENNDKDMLFDGFPRTEKQAESLDKLLDQMGRGHAHVIKLEVPQEVLLQRLLKRAEIEGRKDDNEQTITKRFEEYEKKTSPVATYYKKKGFYTEIYGNLGVNLINQHICEEIDKMQ